VSWFATPDSPAAPTPSTPGRPDTPDTPTAAPAVPVAPDEPPRITHQHPPVYPDVPKPQQKPVDVVVHVAIDAGGVASDPRVLSAANPAFDDLAIASALDATFTPARRAGEPVAGELDVTVHFDPAITGGETISITDRLSAVVRGHATAPSVGAQDIRVQAGQLATAIPHPTGATGLLQWAPGFLMTNEGGEGHAEQIFLRGFDAREGQDLEMRVTGDVVNQAGNLHGNGFLLPELVESLRVVEAPTIRARASPVRRRRSCQDRFVTPA